MSYAPGIFPCPPSLKAQVNGLRVSGPLRHIAPILGGFTAFCSQICSQMSRLAGRSAARRFWTSGFPKPPHCQERADAVTRQVRPQNGRLGHVAGTATVVTVVVKTVVSSRCEQRYAQRFLIPSDLR
jgi:hypothetical protein